MHPVHTDRVAGLFHHQHKSIAIAPGDELTLQPEPENPYDANAIKILLRGAMLGYVPRTSTWRIHPYLASGQRTFACVLAYNYRELIWQFRVDEVLNVVPPAVPEPVEQPTIPEPTEPSDEDIAK